MKHVGVTSMETYEGVILTSKFLRDKLLFTQHMKIIIFVYTKKNLGLNVDKIR